MASHLSYLPRLLTHGNGTVRDEGDILFIDSGVPSDTFNAVCRARLPESRVDEVIDRIASHFRSKQFPFTWWVGPTSSPPDLGERLVAHGLAVGEDEMGMSLNLSRLSPPDPLPSGLEIRHVRTSGELHDYARVIAANWDPPDLCVIDVFRDVEPHVLTDTAPARLFLGSLEGEPVATSECFLANGVAGIYGVVTLPAARNRGIGTALTRAALDEAVSRGFTTAVLQASSTGQRIYARLGFAPCEEFREYH